MCTPQVPCLPRLQGVLQGVPEHCPRNHRFPTCWDPVLQRTGDLPSAHLHNEQHGRNQDEGRALPYGWPGEEVRSTQSQASKLPGHPCSDGKSRHHSWPQPTCQVYQVLQGELYSSELESHYHMHGSQTVPRILPQTVLTRQLLTHPIIVRYITHTDGTTEFYHKWCLT